MISRVPHPAEIRAALWAGLALRRARRGLADGRLRQTVLEAPPALPASAIRGVEGLLRRRRHTCLEGALVRQRWLAAHGVMCDVVIGVTAPADGFEAHAWLESAGSQAAGTKHTEITRVAP